MVRLHQPGVRGRAERAAQAHRSAAATGGVPPHRGGGVQLPLRALHGCHGVLRPAHLDDLALSPARRHAHGLVRRVWPRHRDGRGEPHLPGRPLRLGRDCGVLRLARVAGVLHARGGAGTRYRGRFLGRLRRRAQN